MELLGVRQPFTHFQEEKYQMLELNQRLESYLGRVKLLEEENKLLREEIHTLKSSKNPSGQRKAQEEELNKTRKMKEAAWREKDHVEMEVENLIQDLEMVSIQRQKEKTAQFEAQRKLSDSRKELEDERRAQIWLREKVSQLEKDLLLQMQVHQENMETLQASLKQTKQVLMAPQTTQTTSIPDLGLEYSHRAAHAWKEATSNYQRQVGGLEESLIQAKSNMAKILQEKRENEHQLQHVAKELESTKIKREVLDKHMVQQREEHSQELQHFQDQVDALEVEKDNLGQEIDNLMVDRQNLLQVKMSLGLEVATYRALLDSEGMRINRPTTNKTNSTVLLDLLSKPSGTHPTSKTSAASSHFSSIASTSHRSISSSHTSLTDATPTWTPTRGTEKTPTRMTMTDKKEKAAEESVDSQPANDLQDKALTTTPVTAQPKPEDIEVQKESKTQHTQIAQNVESKTNESVLMSVLSTVLPSSISQTPETESWAGPCSESAGVSEEGKDEDTEVSVEMARISHAPKVAWEDNKTVADDEKEDASEMDVRSEIISESLGIGYEVAKNDNTLTFSQVSENANILASSVQEHKSLYSVDGFAYKEEPNEDLMRADEQYNISEDITEPMNSETEAAIDSIIEWDRQEDNEEQDEMKMLSADFEVEETNDIKVMSPDAEVEEQSEIKVMIPDNVVEEQNKMSPDFEVEEKNDIKVTNVTDAEVEEQHKIKVMNTDAEESNYMKVMDPADFEVEEPNDIKVMSPDAEEQSEIKVMIPDNVVQEQNKMSPDFEVEEKNDIKVTNVTDAEVEEQHKIKVTNPDAEESNYMKVMDPTDFEEPNDIKVMSPDAEEQSEIKVMIPDNVVQEQNKMSPDFEVEEKNDIKVTNVTDAEAEEQHKIKVMNPNAEESNDMKVMSLDTEVEEPKEMKVISSDAQVKEHSEMWSEMWSDNDIKEKNETEDLNMSDNEEIEVIKKDSDGSLQTVDSPNNLYHEESLEVPVPKTETCYQTSNDEDHPMPVEDGEEENNEDDDDSPNVSVSCRTDPGECDSYSQENTLADTRPLIRYKTDEETDVNTPVSHFRVGDTSDSEDERERLDGGRWGESVSKRVNTMEDLSEEPDMDVIGEMITEEIVQGEEGLDDDKNQMILQSEHDDSGDHEVLKVERESVNANLMGNQKEERDDDDDDDDNKREEKHFINVYERKENSQLNEEPQIHHTGQTNLETHEIVNLFDNSLESASSFPDEPSHEVSQTSFEVSSSMFQISTTIKEQIFQEEEVQNISMHTHMDFTDNPSFESEVNSQPDSHISNPDQEECNSSEDESPNASQYFQYSTLSANKQTLTLGAQFSDDGVSKADSGSDNVPEDLFNKDFMEKSGEDHKASQIDDWDNSNLSLSTAATAVITYSIDESSGQLSSERETENLESPNRMPGETENIFGDFEERLKNTMESFSTTEYTKEEAFMSKEKESEIHSFFSASLKEDLWREEKVEMAATYDPAMTENFTDNPIHFNQGEAFEQEWRDLGVMPTANGNSKEEMKIFKVQSQDEKLQHKDEQSRQAEMIPSDGSVDEGDSWSSGDE